MGNGTADGPDGADGYDTPQVVTGITDAETATASGGSVCAVLSTGGTECWGYNGGRPVGHGTIGGTERECWST